MVDEMQYQAGLGLQEEGRALLDEGQLDEAVAKLECALRELERCQPDGNILTYVHLDLAEAYARTGRAEEARSSLARSRSYGEDADFAEVEALVRGLADAPARSGAASVRVRHARFGEGTVIDVRDEKRRVRFDSGEERWLTLDFLEVLGA